MAENQHKKVSYWYFGGLASTMAASCTHPLDLLKVHLQTQQKKEFTLVGMAIKVVKNEGLLALYNGLSASLLRQLTYSMTRFAIYDTYRDRKKSEMPFWEKAVVSMGAGFLGGIVGNPADMVNVRMQNDVKISPESRRNYKHAIDGISRVCKEEGFMRLFSGVSMTATRACFMTFGQLGFYDVFKQKLLETSFFSDNIFTHITASTGAAGIATLMTQPFDVMKTRLMNAKPGTYAGLAACGFDILKTGPFGFFKGLIPAFIRLGPHTVLTFVFLEQLRQNCGFYPGVKC